MKGLTWSFLSTIPPIDDKEKYEGLGLPMQVKGEFLSIFPNDWRWGRY